MTTIRYGLTAAAVLALSACATPRMTLECARIPVAPGGGPALVGTHYGVQMSVLPLNAVLYTNEALSRSVAVQSVHSARSDTDTVVVSARFVNCGDRPQVVRARTHFLDAAQMNAEPASAWRTFTLPANATASYDERSTAVTVDSFYIELAKE